MRLADVGWRDVPQLLRDLVPAVFGSEDAALDDLRSRASRGELMIYGRRGGNSDREPIDAIHWFDLKFWNMKGRWVASPQSPDPRAFGLTEQGSSLFPGGWTWVDQLTETQDCWTDLLVQAADALVPHTGSDTGEPEGTRRAVTRRARKADIRDALRAVYDRADTAGEKPPNVNEVLKPVQLDLKRRGVEASQPQIRQVAEEDEFGRRRLRRGEKYAQKP